MQFVSLKATDKKEKVFTNAVFFTQDEKEKKRKTKKVQSKTQKAKKLFLSFMIQLKLEKQPAADKVSSDCFVSQEYKYAIVIDDAPLDET